MPYKKLRLFFEEPSTEQSASPNPSSTEQIVNDAELTELNIVKVTSPDMPQQAAIITGKAADPPSGWRRILLDGDPITALGSQGQPLQQRPSTYDLWVQIRQAGTEIDPRQIRSLQSVYAVGTDSVSAEATYSGSNAYYYSMLRWGITREPVWYDGPEMSAAKSGQYLIWHTVATGKTGRVFGVHITADEANAYRLYAGTTEIKRFATSGAGTIFIVVQDPIAQNIPAGTYINIQTAAVYTSLTAQYQASMLEDEA